MVLITSTGVCFCQQARATVELQMRCPRLLQLDTQLINRWCSCYRSMPALQQQNSKTEMLTIMLRIEA